jgi:two-component system, NarL family, nitrate/nitrite response regulator NarL
VRLVVTGPHRLVIESLAVALARRGCEVAALATSAWDTFTALAMHEPDICLLGTGFPIGGSLGVLRVIRQRHPDVRVVVVADHQDRDLTAAAARCGAAGLISRDCHICDIMRILLRVRQGKTAFGGGLPAPDTLTLRRPGAPGGFPFLLTAREQDVLSQMLSGGNTQQIAHSLAITEATVRTHVQNVLVKLGAHSRLEATTMVAESGALGAYLPSRPVWRAAGGG